MIVGKSGKLKDFIMKFKLRIVNREAYLLRYRIIVGLAITVPR